MALDYTSLAEATKKFRYSERWALFDGNKDSLNITHECIDRHPRDDVAIRIKFADGRSESHTFGEMSRLTSQFAHFLEKRGIAQGDRVAVILNPSLEFYVTLFGTLKRGAVLVPCFPAFGPEAIGYRLTRAEAKMVVTAPEKVSDVDPALVPHIVVADELLGLLQGEDEQYTPSTSAESPAMTQFSSGTTGVPRIVPYRHAAVTMSALNLKIMAGLRPGDRFFCPSSPAWGHGIWFGTIGPLAHGTSVGAYSGKFRPEVLLQALEEFAITNLSATPLVYRMVMECGKLSEHKLALRDLSYTGGPLDLETILYFRDRLGITPRSMYGSTELGNMLIQYPYPDFLVKPGSMGVPMLQVEMAILDDDGNVAPPGQIGAIALKRNDQWVRSGDAGYVDEDGQYWYKGRADDIIISAGYTIGPQEIEDVLTKHPAVLRAAVVGSPDKDRSEIVKAFIVTDRTPSEELATEIQEFIRTRLSKHEYPREIEFLDALPETPDGKIKRKELRERERARKAGLEER